MEAIEQLASRGNIIYLTSRPERLYKATLDQIEECYISGPELICKPTSAQYVKTKKWKAEQVQELAGKYEDVVFIDDEPANRQAVEELELTNVTCKESLSEARRAERSAMYQEIGDQYNEITLYPHLPCSMCLSTTYRGVLEYTEAWRVTALCRTCQRRLDAKYVRRADG